MSVVEVRRAALEEVLPLRQAVLIAGTNRVSPEFPGDRDPETVHYGAFEDDRLVGCASFLRSEWEGEPAWQLRGMATDPAYRRRGVGKALLAYVEADLRRTHEIRRLWCNARLGAAEFYARNGWRFASETFEIEGVGPHRRMAKNL